MLALYSMSLFQCWLMCVVFHGVGAKRIWDFEEVKKVKPWKREKVFREYLDHNLEVAKDYNGFVFFQATDMFISIVFAQVLQMPKLHQIYVREMQNKMYSPSSFFLAKWFVTTLAYCLQPFIYAFISFHVLQFPDKSFENLLRWLRISCLQGMIGSTFGFMFSSVFSEPMNAFIFMVMYLVIIYFSAGIFATLSAGG